MFGAFDVELAVMVEGRELWAYARAYVSGENGQDLELDQAELEGVELGQVAPELREQVSTALTERAWALAQSLFEDRADGPF
jgi:nicotinamide riboside kinase